MKRVTRVLDMFNHQIEKELLQATPRHLRRKSTTANKMGMGFLRIFLLPFIAGGIGTLLTALLATSVIFNFKSAIN